MAEAKSKMLGRIFSRSLQNMVAFITYEEADEVRKKVWESNGDPLIRLDVIDKDGGPVQFIWRREDVIGFSIGYVGHVPMIEGLPNRSPLS